jgi:predicted amidohydrolase
VLGLTVCYDLRFPELFRILALGGAGAITVPSAFTAVTGRDHWEVLLRARAIENQLYVIAAGQVGAAPPHYDSWGHSMVVGPWGDVLDVVTDGEGHAIAELDLAELERVRERVPSLANRRADAYRWPDGEPDRSGGTRSG